MQVRLAWELMEDFPSKSPWALCKNLHNIRLRGEVKKEENLTVDQGPSEGKQSSIAWSMQIELFRMTGSPEKPYVKVECPRMMPLLRLFFFEHYKILWGVFYLFWDRSKLEQWLGVTIQQGWRLFLFKCHKIITRVFHLFWYRSKSNQWFEILAFKTLAQEIPAPFPQSKTKLTTRDLPI